MDESLINSCGGPTYKKGVKCCKCRVRLPCNYDPICTPCARKEIKSNKIKDAKKAKIDKLNEKLIDLVNEMIEGND